MELLVTWGHLLDKGISDSISACDLTGYFALVGGHVWDQGLTTGLTVINYKGTEWSFKCHLHCHCCSLSLSWVLCFEFLHFDVLFVGWFIVKNHNFHGVLVFLWTLKFNNLASFPYLVLWLCSSNFKLNRKSLELSFVLNSKGTFFCNLSSSAWSLNFEINFFVWFFVLGSFNNAFISYLVGVLFDLLLEFFLCLLIFITLIIFLFSLNLSFFVILGNLCVLLKLLLVFLIFLFLNQILLVQLKFR